MYACEYMYYIYSYSNLLFVMHLSGLKVETTVGYFEEMGCIIINIIIIFTI